MHAFGALVKNKNKSLDLLSRVCYLSNAHRSTDVAARMCMCVCVHVCACMSVRMHACLCMHVCVHMCVCVHVYACVSVCVCVCVCVHLHVCVCVCVPVLIKLCVCECMHAGFISASLFFSSFIFHAFMLFNGLKIQWMPHKAIHPHDTGSGCGQVKQEVSWCFEPSQPHRVTSGLKINFSLSPVLCESKICTTLNGDWSP